MIGPLANGLSFVRNFIGPCLWVALAGFIAGSASVGWGAYKITRGLHEARALRAETALANFRAEIATQTAAAEILARQRQDEAATDLRKRDQAITSALNRIPALVAAEFQPVRIELRSLINAPQYDCLRTAPLPSEYLDRLRRPGGEAESAAVSR